MSNIPERIKDEMEKQLWSGRALCSECGVDPGLLSRYLNGKSELSVRSLEAVLGVLGYELSIKNKRSN